MNPSTNLSPGVPFLLRWEEGVERPTATIDFGPETAGGYAAFEVESFSPRADGTPPVLRLSYATHPDGLSETGDFSRETEIRYLHVDNPVLPANPDRHEIYTIPRTGVFVAPLIQGQARYVRAWLDTPGTAVSVGGLRLVNAGVYSTAPAIGAFEASDPRMGAVWRMCARTIQLASFPNANAWRVVEGVLLPRKLERGEADGWCRFVPDFSGTLEVVCEFRRNPHFDGPAFFDVFTGWLDAEPAVLETVRQQGPDGAIRAVRVPLKPGRFGFRLEKEQWPVIHQVRVLDESGEERWRDDFASADNWVYSTTLPYIADGGKRDRLVWSGDLWWAQRSVYCCFGPDDPYMAGALRLLAFNQTPEGYVQACPYAENAVRPRSGEYGLFASDEFSAWFVPCLWEHFLFTGDEALARELWPTADRDLAYLASHLGEDGLFVQRLETSKHAGRMTCGDTSHRLYADVLYWMCWRDGAKLARAIGDDRRALELERLAVRHAAAIRAAYRDDDAPSGWRNVLDDAPRGESGASARLESVASGGTRLGQAMLLASGFATPDEAARIMPVTGPDIGKAKMQALLIRGKLRYGYVNEAFADLEKCNWHALCDDSWQGAHTSSECGFLTRSGYFDESHPDTAIADIYSCCVLGVEPVAPGFSRFRVAPQMPDGLSFARGRVPTPHGPIDVSLTRHDGKTGLSLEVPQGAVCEFNGRELNPGHWQFD